MPISVQNAITLLQVFDMPAAIHFYCDVLGFKVVTTSETLPNGSFQWAMLQLAGVQLMLNTAYDSNDERPAVPEAARVAAHADTIIYFECSDVDAAYNHLLTRGVHVSPPSVAYYGMRQLYVNDPDGYELCFQWPANL